MGKEAEKSKEELLADLDACNTLRLRMLDRMIEQETEILRLKQEVNALIDPARKLGKYPVGFGLSTTDGHHST